MPCGKINPNAEKNTIRDTAMTISLFIIGSWLTVRVTRFARFLRQKMPTEENAPSTVLIAVADKASISVFLIADTNAVASSLNRDL